MTSKEYKEVKKKIENIKSSRQAKNVSMWKQDMGYFNSLPSDPYGGVGYTGKLHQNIPSVNYAKQTKQMVQNAKDQIDYPAAKKAYKTKKSMKVQAAIDEYESRPVGQKRKASNQSQPKKTKK